MKYTWRELIKYIFNFIFHRKKIKEIKEQKKKEELDKKIQAHYDKIDRDKNRNKNDDTKKRLDNMF